MNNRWYDLAVRFHECVVRTTPFRFDSKTHEDLGLICFVKEVQNIAISRIYTVVQDEKTVVQWRIDPVDIGGTGKLGVQ